MRFWTVLGAVLLTACQSSAERPPALEDLLREERELLAERSKPLSALEAFGADPCQVDYLPGLDRYLVLLRNASQVLLCSPRLEILDRQPAPRSPTAWDRKGERLLFVGGEQSSSLSIFSIAADRLHRERSIPLRESASIRDLAYVDQPSPALFLLDDFDGRLVRLELESGRERLYPLGFGPLQVLHRDGHLIINLLLEHSILVLPLQDGIPDFSRASRISQQGPFWSLDALVQGDRLILAAGGIENRPLDRSGGEFGNVDSFLYLFELHRREGVFRWDGDSAGKSSRINLSELGVVTPKALSLLAAPDGTLDLWVTGYGAEKLAHFQLIGLEPRLERLADSPPGINSLRVRKEASGTLLALANPLLDRVELASPQPDGDLKRQALLDLSRDRRTTPETRLGEILFFTTLLAPSNTSRGELSRLSCEACHFEGGIDGRVHYTGRADIHAVTKPLRGLSANLPLFSRAGDQTLSSMVMAEFRAVNQQRRDVFELRRAHHPWLDEVEKLPERLSPAELRRAFLSFFIDFQHRPNPWRLRNRSLDARAQQGLDVFRQHCEDCHQAVPSTRDDSKAVPFEDWPDWLTGDRDLVWGAPFYSKTGIRPYVDPAGARVPSLRRVWLKHPYFTNGSSTSIRDVLERFRYRGSTVWHHLDRKDEPGAQALTTEEIEALEALLRFF